MNNIIKNIKNNDGSVDKIIANSFDNNVVAIGSNYKLIKFGKNKKQFKDTLLGSDIGIHSSGFISVTISSLIIAMLILTLMYLSFRI